MKVFTDAKVDNANCKRKKKKIRNKNSSKSNFCPVTGTVAAKESIKNCVSHVLNLVVLICMG